MGLRSSRPTWLPMCCAVESHNCRPFDYFRQTTHPSCAHLLIADHRIRRGHWRGEVERVAEELPCKMQAPDQDARLVDRLTGWQVRTQGLDAGLQSSCVPAACQAAGGGGMPSYPPCRGVLRSRMPVSSSVSRTAHSTRLSPSSKLPPGKHHLPAGAAVAGQGLDVWGRAQQD